jgi:hypothetical protein
MKKISLIVILLLIASAGYAETMHTKDVKKESAQAGETLESFADQAMAEIENSEFAQLFDHFYLPENYTSEDIENDKEAILSGLSELIHNKLGLLKDFSRVDSITEQVFTIAIATGTMETSEYLTSTDLFYKVEFEDFGPGYIVIGVHKKIDDLSIKNIIFGLPSSNPESVGIGQDFVKFMMDIASAQNSKRNKGK